MTQRRIALALVLGAALIAAGCGGGGSSDTGTNLTGATLQTTTDTSGAAGDVIAAYSGYIKALDAKDGATVCQLLVPAGTEKLRPPVKRESCAEAITESIGHPGPTGLKWTSARLSGSPSAQVFGKVATLSVTVENTYSDGTTKAEKEAVRMSLVDGSWLLDEPDATLYRAIGQK